MTQTLSKEPTPPMEIEAGSSRSRDEDHPEEITNSDESHGRRHLCKSEMLAIHNLNWLIKNLGTRAQGLTFAEENGLILSSKECSVHHKPMRIQFNTSLGSFSCNRGSCRSRSRIPRTRGTCFERTSSPLPHIYYLWYCFAHDWPYDRVMIEDILKYERGKCLSSSTITDWFRFCREVVVMYYLEKQEFKGKIGGPGKIVQVDEGKFGNRKLNKGQRFSGSWVLGLIEDGSEDLRLEVCPDNVRTADVLVPLVKKHVHEGTTIHTDYWQAYDSLGQHGYIHKRVNHSDPENPFVAPDGTHTQRIDSQWRMLKKHINRHCNVSPENFADILVEYLWRRSVMKSKKDPFIEVVNAIKYVYKK